ncbi:MAG: hypothetical protein K2K45_06715 [Muribaculaceae bacterium]|nr:hypothetical protein [Muribaculaceae bacterium]MDE7097214.1 hypothetical protein [Muribaculaceae bacterium]
MITLIITLTMLACILVIALAVSLREGRTGDDEDRGYRDQDGDHVYYDQSIIEKKEFSKVHPKEGARTFRRLFKKK